MEAERSQVQWGLTAIPYEIRRSGSRATVSIAVEPSGEVVLTAPRTAGIDRLDRLVLTKAPWIVEKRKGRSERPPAPTREFVAGETFLYLGRQYRLRVDGGALLAGGPLADARGSGPLAYARGSKRCLPRSEALRQGAQAPAGGIGPLVLEHGWLRIGVPGFLEEQHRAGYVRAALVDWYLKRARIRLPERVAHWSGKLRVAMPRVLIREPKKRWGSCHPSGLVRLNWRIVQAPLRLVDYVVAHELCHLLHEGHGRRFWATLGAAMPDYEARRASLVELGARLIW